MSWMLIPVYLVIFAFGAVIGSFLNVCIFRIPEGQSIVTVPSHCMNCGYRLKWYDLIPIVSWLFLKGKCRKCGQPISVQYPLIEAANGFLWILIFRNFDLELIPSLLTALLGSALIVLSVIDARTMEIPEGITIFIAVLGLIHMFSDLSWWWTYVIGLVCVSGVLLLIYLISRRRAIGGGDIKLMAAAGLFLGWKKIILAFFIACLVGTVIHLILMKVQGKGRQLAMGPYLSLGILLSALWGERMIDAYLGLFMPM